MRSRRELLRVPVLGLTLVLLVAALARLGFSPDRDGDGVPDRTDRCPRTPAGWVVDSDGCCSAVRALAAGVRSMLETPSVVHAGELWMLKKLSGVYPDPDLKRLVHQAIERLEDDKSARLVDPNAPRAVLPENPGRGLIKLMYYVLAPTGTPESRGVEFIRDFLSRDGTGYVLTHQYLVLEWAGEMGLALPESVRSKKGPLLERIAAEQAADPRFSDLFAERAAILLAFRPVERATATAWVETILSAQTEEGRWVDAKGSPLTFDGQTAVARHPWGHTTGFATAAIGFYLHRYRAE